MIENVPPVEDPGGFYHGGEGGFEVDRFEFVPFGEDEEGVGSGEGFSGAGTDLETRFICGES